MWKILLIEWKDKLGGKMCKPYIWHRLSIWNTPSPQISTLKKHTIHLQNGPQTFHRREHIADQEAHEEELAVIKPSGKCKLKPQWNTANQWNVWTTATNMKTTMQHRPTRLAQITVMPPNAGKDAKQVDRFPTAAGNIKCPALKHRLAIP